MVATKIVEGLLRLGFSLPRMAIYTLVFSIIWTVVWRLFRHRRFYWVVWLGILGLSLCACITLAWQLFLLEPLSIKPQRRSGPGGGMSLHDLRSAIRALHFRIALFYPIWLASFPLSIVFAALGPGGMSRKSRLAILVAVLIVSGSLLGFTLHKAQWYQEQYEFVIQYR